MEKVIVIPFESVNQIFFNESREQVRTQYVDYKEFKKNRFSKNTTDSYTSFHVFYDESNKVEAVEIFTGVKIILNNTDISDFSKDELSTFVHDKLEDCDEYGIKFPSIGLCVSTEGENVSSYLFYRAGYWD